MTFLLGSAFGGRLRIRFHYRLRTLFAFVFLTSVPLAWCAAKFQMKRAERHAVARIRELGGGVCYDWQPALGFLAFEDWEARSDHVDEPRPPGPGWLRQLLGDDAFTSVVVVYWPHSRIDSSSAEAIATFGHLRSLILFDSTITSEGMAHLVGLRHLNKLELQGTAIDDVAMRHIGRLKSLSELRLDATRITGVGLAKLAGLARLEHLHLNGTRIDDQSLRHLSRMTRLVHLELDDTRISDAGIAHLRGLERLESLSLCRTSVHGAGLSAICHCYELKLRETPLDDAALAHLNSVCGLAILDLAHTQVTGSGFADLVVPTLRSLNVSYSPITPAGLLCIGRLTSLESLNLDHTCVADPDAPAIEGLHLGYASLDDTRLTPIGIKHLRRIWWENLQAFDPGSDQDN